VRELIRGMAGERTVIVASHVLTEIERVATRIMILRDGELLTADALAEAGGAPRFRLTIEAPPAAVLPVLRNIAGVTAAAVDPDAGGDGAYVVETDRSSMGENLARAVVGAGFGLAGLVEEKPDLERIFLDLTRRAVEARAA
jgi:ABC-2 type transport system ATP-binding protein